MANTRLLAAHAGSIANNIAIRNPQQAVRGRKPVLYYEVFLV